MTATQAKPPIPQSEFPRRVRWTRSSFARAWELGLFGHSHVELVYGEVIEKMPMNPPHALVVQLLQGALLQVFASGRVVRVQLPFLAADESQPEPDLSVVSGNAFDFAREHPREALLLVEVSDSTLSYDLGTKATLYAQSGVPEYWVADLGAGLLHVYRQPLASPAFAGGYGFQSIARLTRADTVTPLGGAVSIPVGDILPVL